MAKKQFNIGDLVAFYHWDFEDRVHGLVKEVCPNNMVTVAYNHPAHGYQLLGLHTSAIQLVDMTMVDLSPDMVEAVKQTVFTHDHALRMLSK
jgi:hypothetical protein